MFGRKCKQYKLIDANDINISTIKNGVSPITNILLGENRETIIQIMDVIQQIDFTNSNIANLLQKAIQTIGGTIATVLSMGGGGDMIVNSAFTIKHAITLLAKVITTIDEISKTMMTDNEIDDDAIRLVMDLLNMDFKDGPNGIKCWVEQIIRKYNTENSRLFVCELVRKVYPNMVAFISNLIGSSVPDIGIVVIHAVEKAMMTNFGKGMVMKGVIRNVRRQYNKIPQKFRKIIANPPLMSELIRKRLEPLLNYLNGEKSNKKTSKSFFRLPHNVLADYAKSAVSTITSTVAETFISPDQFNKFIELVNVSVENSEYIAYIINKLMAFTFASLYFIELCSI